jgi:hypothetical protein
MPTAPARLSALLLLVALALALGAVPSARANLIQDGDFTDVTYSGTVTGLTTLFGEFGSGGTLKVADWTTSGYNFVYAPDTADTGSKSGANMGAPNEAPGQYNTSAGYGNTYMWGSNNGGTAPLPATDPDGGNFVADDGAAEVGPISQAVTGLTVGQTYVLKFYWAAAQQESFTGDTTETWKVSLGSQTFYTGTYSLTSKGFSGWMQDTMYFTSTNASETLSFLAVGTPSGDPPFSLLGGLDLEVVPDFSNWIAFAGFGGICVGFEVMRRRRRQSAPSGC